jgi:hypothetical protein
LEEDDFLGDTDDEDEDYTPCNEDMEDYFKMIELHTQDGKPNQSNRKVKGIVTK